MASAVSFSTGLVNAMTQPKALSGSLASAFSQAPTWVASTAAPQGLLCLTMMQPWGSPAQVT